MRGHFKLTTVLLFLITCLFLYGIVTLFTMRFEKGDVYPVYSSLRADPLGTKIFYESLETLKEIATIRNYRALSQISDDERATIFYFGAPSISLHSMDKDDVERLERVIAHGSRFVILFYPERKSIRQKTTDDKKQVKDTQPTKEGKDTDTKHEKSSEEKRCGYLRCPVSLLDRWGFHYDFHEQFVQGDHAHRAHDLTGTGSHGLPESISWHSALYFDRINESWTPVYTLKGHPVIIERTFGRGKIIMSTDTYFVSNEALLKERRPTLHGLSAITELWCLMKHISGYRKILGSQPLLENTVSTGSSLVCSSSGYSLYGRIPQALSPLVMGVPQTSRTTLWPGRITCRGLSVYCDGI
jgi:hypothetical protein